MNRNIYIAYLLWFFLGYFGAHRIYCGKFFSGFLQLAIFWIGSATAFLLFGFVFLGIWGLWWLVDAFLTQNWVRDINETHGLEHSLKQTQNLKNIKSLYELYKNGAISREEYERKKTDIIN